MWENIKIFGALTANFHQKLVARGTFFIGKSWKTAFFSFREITPLGGQKNEKFQKKHKLHLVPL